jgi:predicted methyltransferase
MRRFAIVLVPLAVTLSGCHQPQANQGNQSEIIARAVADPARPAAYKAADKFRKPAETLAFAGVRPGMVVGEFYPAGGYFTRMLSDVVGPGGHIYAIENKGWNDSVKDDQAMLAEGKWKNVSLDVQPFGTVNFRKPLDLAWVTQNYHDLKIPQYGNVDTVAFDRAVYAALKPGGIFFILDHQGWPGMTPADIAKVHRVDKAGDPRGHVRWVPARRRRRLPSPGLGRPSSADFRKEGARPHRSICAEVREAGEVAARTPRRGAS